MEDIPRELNAKAYAIMIKKEKSLNQQLDKQLKVECYMLSPLIWKIHYHSDIAFLISTI